MGFERIDVIYLRINFHFWGCWKLGSDLACSLGIDGRMGCASP